MPADAIHNTHTNKSNIESVTCDSAGVPPVGFSKANSVQSLNLGFVLIEHRGPVSVEL